MYYYILFFADFKHKYFVLEKSEYIIGHGENAILIYMFDVKTQLK